MTTTTLNGRDLRSLLDADQAQRRYERRNGRGRRVQRSKRQRDAWKNETWA